MSGAAGLAAARRRRGNPQPTPQRMPQQPQPTPQIIPQQQSSSQVQGGATSPSPNPVGPTTPMTILHQHHIKLEEHDKLFEEIKSQMELIKDLNQHHPPPPITSLPEMEMNQTMLDQIKNNMIDPLENDLQSVLSGYQLKIDMLSSTLNSQQNYILELNTTLLGVVKQMTKLLAIKDNENNDVPVSSSPHSSSVMPVTDERMETDYIESDPPDPYSLDNSPVATFGRSSSPEVIPLIPPLAEEKSDISTENSMRHINDMVDDDCLNIMDVDNDISKEIPSSSVPILSSGPDPLMDLTVE